MQRVWPVPPESTLLEEAMIIHCLSPTHSSHGILTSRLQICASVLLTDVSQPTLHHDQKQ
jgi:hypothetical protein